MNRSLYPFIVALVLVISAMIAQPGQARAGVPVTVKFYFEEFRELHCNEGFGEVCPNDYYFRVRIANGDWADSSIFANTSVISPLDLSGAGSGRIYTVRVTASDSGGGGTLKEITVSVPHSQSTLIFDRFDLFPFASNGKATNFWSLS